MLTVFRALCLHMSVIEWHEIHVYLVPLGITDPQEAQSFIRSSSIRRSTSSTSRSSNVTTPSVTSPNTEYRRSAGT
jgi:hypothetical protein